MRRWGPIGLVLLVAALGAHPAAAAGPTAYTYDTTAVGIDRPFTIGIAGDGTVWVGGSGAYLHNFPSRILRFDPFTGNALSGWPKTTEATASVPGINDLLVDGNDVWVADQTKSTITRARVLQNDIAPGYPKATGGTAPQGLAIGPDGDLWVANLNSNNVSRFDHSSGGQIGGYPKPTGNPSTDQIVGANDVTIGDDGDAWVSIWDPGAGKGEVTRLDGVTGDFVTGYPETLNSTTKTVAIATGLDGDIWVASESSDLSRLDPETGAQRLGYPKYTEQMQTGDMAIGPDGDVWITDQALSKVIRVDGDTGAAVQGYPLSLPDQWRPLGIAFDAKGDPWIAVEGFGGVVRIALDGKPLDPGKRALAVKLAGKGRGTVTGPGVSCPSDCSQSYDYGASVTLKAAPAAKSKFAGWSGPCTGTGDCKITMSAARTVTATFATKSPTPQTTIRKLKVKARNATVSFNAKGGVKPLKFQCKLDGAKKWRSCKSPLELKDLSLGKHTIRVRARDAKGHTDPTPAKRKFSVKA